MKNEILEQNGVTYFSEALLNRRLNFLFAAMMTANVLMGVAGYSFGKSACDPFKSPSLTARLVDVNNDGKLDLVLESEGRKATLYQDLENASEVSFHNQPIK